MIRPRLAVGTLIVCLAAAMPAHARAEPAPLEPKVQRMQDVKDPPVVVEKRAVVLDPQAEVISIAAAATILIQNGDLPWLRGVLGGTETRPALGVLAALGQAPPESCEALLPDIVVLAARTTDGEIRKAADGALDNQLEGAAAGALSPPRVRSLLAWLADPQQPAARRVVVMRALGRSGELTYVEPLIDALGGDSAAEARDALHLLTGHDLGAEADAVAWHGWWAGHSRYTREQLLELALQDGKHQIESQKSAFDKERAALIQKAVEARLDKMGEGLDALLLGLTDEYPDVRLEAARRLAAKGNDARATTALPVLLRRLGHAPAGNGVKAGNGPIDPPTEGAETVESDPRVRAALVTALGVLGRAREESDSADSGPREDVLAALASELRSSDAAVTSAAAAALEQFHDQPAVVRPLLDYVSALPADNSPASVDVRVKALLAIAANTPSDVVRELLPFAADGQPDGVRAAAVRAIMACDDIALALDVLGDIYSRDPSPDVGFSIAAALGDRLGRPGAAGGDATRTRMVAQLGNLLEDPAVSVRLEAVTALGRARLDTAFTLLDNRARKETDPNVQQRLVKALGALQKPEGAAVIGVLLVSRTVADDRATLLGEAQKALALIAGDRTPAAWLECAEALHTAGAHDAAAWCCREAARRFGDQPELRDGVDQARGRLPVELLHDGLAREARDLLLQLESEKAPLPAPDARILLLADASAKMEDWAAEADYRQRHLHELPVGDSRHGAETLTTARALRRAGRNAEAVPLLTEHLEAHADDNEALLDLAAAEEALGQLEAALHDLERLLDRLPAGDALRAQVISAHDRVQGLVIQPAAPSGSNGGEGGEQKGESVGAAPASGGTSSFGVDGAN